MDSVPIVAITCNVASSLLGKDSFQEVDITGITMSITKHNYIVRRVEDIADVMREAFAIAKSGRPGQVLIDIPKATRIAIIIQIVFVFCFFSVSALVSGFCCFINSGTSSGI